ncbi:MAG: DUF2207 domain-containing protein [Deltaproteobacteria bacterium]|nr:DUF2207 domain-containing protein [Deltaproteobacteria bacterium]
MGNREKKGGMTAWARFPLLALAVLFCCLGFLGSPAAAAPPERILDFHSRIVVHPDATMTVTETIKVKSAGQEIRRGIIRDFPTTYKDRLGNTVKVDFKVEQVWRDGKPEPYHIEDVTNGVKIRIGQKDVFLRPNVYTYVITYHTGRQLGYFQDFDELYWNVTGTGWTFAMDRAGATVALPPGAKILQHAAYTGPQGAKGKDFSVSYDREGRIVFITTRGLGPREGLTIAVAWPKGLVHQPSGQEKMGHFLKDNLSAAVALIWLGVLLCFYLFTWVQVGKDPAKGVIIPLFTPPKGFSPPSVRYLNRMGFDNKAMAAAVVDMAVKGYLTIEENDGEFTLRQKQGGKGDLSSGEIRVSSHLFSSSDTLVLQDSNHAQIKGVLKALQEALKKELNKVYFNTNSGYFISGLVLTLIGLGAIALTSADKFAAGFSALWLTVWTVAVYALGVNAIRRWQSGRILSALGATLFFLPFFAGEIVGLAFLTFAISLVPACLLALMVVLDGLFYHLLKAPTLQGRKIMDQIEGFKLYLSVAEKERLEVLHPPEKTPELFEKYLPYALALDVENEWSQQFADVLARAQVDGRAYSPSWYSGGSWDHFGSSGFASSLGDSFSGAIASSSSPPGSDSGSGGGGSSGGGGGGGGGSGW